VLFLIQELQVHENDINFFAPEYVSILGKCVGSPSTKGYTNNVFRGDGWGGFTDKHREYITV
jgi:hypothetical protein